MHNNMRDFTGKRPKLGINEEKNQTNFLIFSFGQIVNISN